MKKYMMLVSVLVILIVMVGCATVSDVVGEKAKEVVTGEAAGAKDKTTTGAVDFKKDEVLCALEDRPLEDNFFQVARIVTSPSDATKNQAEVLYVGSGEKKWTTAVIPSHKASKNELTLTRMVFYNCYYSYEDMTDERYRRKEWRLGRISSTDELFKNVVEVNGEKMFVQWIRIPDEPIE